jgi:Cu-Zn family superoxide dismutase
MTRCKARLAGFGLAAALTTGGCSHSGGRTGSPGPEPLASGTFRDAAGERIGVATLTETAGTLRLGVSVGSLTPGRHGLHFHAQGTCTPPDFASAGAHFNPGGRKHGRLNPEGPHLGDVPNLVIGPTGSADTSFMVPNELVASGPSSLLQPSGAALVIHADADDERTDPSGNSGARVACAVIEPG